MNTLAKLALTIGCGILLPSAAAHAQIFVGAEALAQACTRNDCVPESDTSNPPQWFANANDFASETFPFRNRDGIAVPYGPVVAEAFALSDLAQGVLRSYASSQYLIPVIDVPTGQVLFGGEGSFAHARSSLGDIVVFGGEGPFVDATFNLTIGGFLRADPLENGSATMDYSTVISALGGDRVVFSMQQQAGLTNAVNVIGGGFTETSDGTWSGTFRMPTNVLVSIESILWARTNSEAEASFGNSAFFDIDLPEGYFFTSQSGVFLTQQLGSSPAGVPEPATWAMMLLGFGFLGGMMRRRKQVAPRYVARLA